MKSSTTARIEKKPQFLAPTTPSATHARLLVALRYTLVICQDQELASKCDRGYSPEAREALLKSVLIKPSGIRIVTLGKH